jgi:hypothetical protein
MASLALPVIGGLAGLFGKPTTTTTNTSGNSTETDQMSGSTSSDIQTLLNTLSSIMSLSNIINQGQTTSSSTPTFTGAGQDFMDKLLTQYGAINKPVDMQGYQAGQTASINQNADLQRQSVANDMASRGLSTSPAAGTANANIDANRVAQINSMNAGIPILQNQLQLQNAAQSANILNALPRGMTNTGTTMGTQSGTSSQQGTNTQQGQTVQQSQTMSDLIKNLISQQTSVSKGSSGGGIGGFLGGLGAVLGGR